MNKTLSKIINIIKKNNFLFLPYLFVRDFISYIKYILAKNFSQHGEEKFLLGYFGDKFTGLYVDIGASHPFRISNTFALYRKGWSGIAVDPIPVFSNLYRVWRPRDTFINVGIAPISGELQYYELTPSVLSSFDKNYIDQMIASEEASINKIYKVDVISPNDLFELQIGSKTIDYLSIDVEGLDFSIIEAINFEKYRPRLIGVEFNSEKDKIAILSLLASNDYICEKIIACNIFAKDNRK